jgi:hypothetical protein
MSLGPRRGPGHASPLYNARFSVCLCIRGNLRRYASDRVQTRHDPSVGARAGYRLFGSRFTPAGKR